MDKTKISLQFCTHLGVGKGLILMVLMFSGLQAEVCA